MALMISVPQAPCGTQDTPLPFRLAGIVRGARKKSKARVPPRRRESAERRGGRGARGRGRGARGGGRGAGGVGPGARGAGRSSRLRLSSCSLSPPDPAAGGKTPQLQQGLGVGATWLVKEERDPEVDAVEEAPARSSAARPRAAPREPRCACHFKAPRAPGQLATARYGRRGNYPAGN